MTGHVTRSGSLCVQSGSQNQIRTTPVKLDQYPSLNNTASQKAFDETPTQVNLNLLNGSNRYLALICYPKK